MFTRFDISEGIKPELNKNAKGGNFGSLITQDYSIGDVVDKPTAGWTQWESTMAGAAVDAVGEQMIKDANYEEENKEADEIALRLDNSALLRGITPSRALLILLCYFWVARTLIIPFVVGTQHCEIVICTTMNRSSPRTMSESLSSNAVTPWLPRIKLDPSLYDPTREEVEFLKSQTKIGDEEELKQHVLAVQKEAWAIVNYRCIQAFGFMTLKITYLPAYSDLLTLGKERQDAIFLDLACCFGNDTRKAIADGYPMENVVASDLEGAFWDLGHRLFRSSPETFPVPFIQGNVFDPQNLAPAPPFYSPPTTPRPVLSTLTSLTPLLGHVSALHTSAFFHLFGKEEQIAAARAVAPLLSPVPGSMIFGTHTSLEVSGGHTLAALEVNIYCFNPADWCALWDGVVFKKGSVRAEAALVYNDTWRGKGFETDTEEARTKRVSMVWCVKRI